jgi:hypothetical protein
MNLRISEQISEFWYLENKQKSKNLRLMKRLYVDFTPASPETLCPDHQSLQFVVVGRLLRL